MTWEVLPTMGEPDPIIGEVVMLFVAECVGVEVDCHEGGRETEGLAGKGAGDARLIMGDEWGFDGGWIVVSVTVAGIWTEGRIKCIWCCCLESRERQIYYLNWDGWRR